MSDVEAENDRRINSNMLEDEAVEHRLNRRNRVWAFWKEVGSERPVSKGFRDWFEKFQKTPEGKIDKSPVRQDGEVGQRLARS